MPIFGQNLHIGAATFRSQFIFQTNLLPSILFTSHGLPFRRFFSASAAI